MTLLTPVSAVMPISTMPKNITRFCLNTSRHGTSEVLSPAPASSMIVCSSSSTTSASYTHTASQRRVIMIAR